MTFVKIADNGKPVARAASSSCKILFWVAFGSKIVIDVRTIPPVQKGFTSAGWDMRERT
jgi:hypothetical protein